MWTVFLLWLLTRLLHPPTFFWPLVETYLDRSVPSSVLQTTFFCEFHTIWGCLMPLACSQTCRHFSAPVAVSQPLAFSVSQLGETYTRLSRGSFGEPLTRIRIRTRHSSTPLLFGRGLSSGSHRLKWTPWNSLPKSSHLGYFQWCIPNPSESDLYGDLVSALLVQIKGDYILSWEVMRKTFL